MISIIFNGATGHEERAPGTGAMHIRTPGAGCPALARGRPEGHLALGRLQCTWQISAPPDIWVLAKARLTMAAPTPCGVRAAQAPGFRFSLLL
jgi:hypothetical protein